MRTLMDSLNAVLNREEGYLFDYDRLRAVLTQDRHIEALHRIVQGDWNYQQVVSIAREAITPREPAQEVVRWDCPECGRGNLVQEVFPHPEHRCDHCNAKIRKGG